MNETVVLVREGRVVAGVGSEEVEVGLYVCGWVKRGPSGIIGEHAHSIAASGMRFSRAQIGASAQDQE